MLLHLTRLRLLVGLHDADVSTRWRCLICCIVVHYVSTLRLLVCAVHSTVTVLMSIILMTILTIASAAIIAITAITTLVKIAIYWSSFVEISVSEAIERSDHSSFVVGLPRLCSSLLVFIAPLSTVYLLEAR